MSVEVRKLDDGATVVDLGAKWFRVERAGTVIAKEAVNVRGQEFATVRRRIAYPHEVAFVLAEIGKAERGRA